MSDNNHKHLLEPGEKLELMPSIDHPFVTSPAQSATAILSEYQQSAGICGVIILHYAQSDGINIKICHSHCIQWSSNKFKIVAFNYFRTSHWNYKSEFIYKIKFIPMVFQDGTLWPKEKQKALVSYFFDLGKKAEAYSNRSAQPEKIVRALNGERVIPPPKQRSRVAKWLVRHGILKS